MESVILTIPVKCKQDAREIAEEYYGVMMWRGMSDGSMVAYPDRDDNPITIEFAPADTGERMKTHWQELKTCGYPPPDDDKFYGARYSVPILAGNVTTGQVALEAYMWDYKGNGWVLASLKEGTDPGDYEVQHVSHWKMWPKCAVASEDQDANLI